MHLLTKAPVIATLVATYYSVFRQHCTPHVGIIFAGLVLFRFSGNDRSLLRGACYLNAAWQLGQDGVVADHLGQLYEKERRSSAALHMYNLALEANPHLV
jgi:hypothetical protein